MTTEARRQLYELAARTEGIQPWRRLFHLVAGLGLAWIIHKLSPESATTRWLLGSTLAVTFIVDFGRLKSDALNQRFFRVFSALASPRQVESLSITWFLCGVFLVLWFPGRTVAVASVLVLSVADPAASVVGRVWGTRRLGKGTLAGTTAFLLAAVAVLIPFVGFGTAVLVATVVSAAEVLSAPLDDNVVIPVVTAACLSAVTALS